MEMKTQKLPESGKTPVLFGRLAVGALALAACIGPAAAVDFPAAGGNRDLADSAAWGGTPPASTDDVTFK